MRKKIIALALVSFVVATADAKSWLHVKNSAPAACDLNTIPNLELEFDPRFNTRNGSNQVTVWTDQGPNHNNATQSAGSTAYVYTTNVFGSLPGLKSEAANSQFMTLTNHVTGMTEFTGVFLIKASSGSNMYLFAGSGGSGGAVLRINAGTQMSPWDGGSGFSIWNGTQTIAGETHLFTVQSTTVPNTAVIKQNGVQLTDLVTSSGSSWSMEVQYTAGRVAASAFADGYLGPWILYRRSISGSELTYVTDCLHQRGWN